MDKLTPFEEEIMLIIWRKKNVFVKDIIDAYGDKAPHYNTIATMLKILKDKNFIAHETFGKSYRYYPLINKEKYIKNSFQGVMKNYFEGSYKNLVSFFVKEKKVSIKELEKLVDKLKKDNV